MIKVKNIKQRMHNYGFWVSLIALISLIWKTYDPNFPIQAYDEITSAVLGILVLLGIVSDPTTKSSGFLDDK